MVLEGRSYSNWMGEVDPKYISMRPRDAVIVIAGSAVLAVPKGPQSQFRHCWWYRSSHGTDVDIPDIAGPE